MNTSIYSKMNNTNQTNEIVSINTARIEYVYIFIAALCLFGILSCITNGIVIRIGLKREKVFSVSIISLAFTDFFSGLICTPILCAIYYLKYRKKNGLSIEWDFGPFSDYKYSIPNGLKFCTCFHLMYIAANRLWNIKKVGTGRQKHRRKLEVVAVLFIWILSMSLCFVTPSVEHDVPWCDRVMPKVDLWLFIVFPVVMTIILDIFMFYIANQLSKNVKSVTNTSQMRGGIVENVEVAKTTAMVVVALIISYLPLTVKWIYCGLNNPNISLFVQALVAANSFVNPLIYAYKMPKFRQALRATARPLSTRKSTLASQRPATVTSVSYQKKSSVTPTRQDSTVMFRSSLIQY